MTRRLGAFLTAAMLALGLAACASAPLEVRDDVSDLAVADYRLGTADRLRITVFGEPALSGEFAVGADGQLALPLIGAIRASGLTTREVQDAIARTLGQGYMLDPRVSAEVLAYRPFYILGEVNRPGEYPYAASLTVLNAVATAQGFTYRANTRRVYIRRADGSEERLYALTAATPVAPGDTIRIGERFF